MDELERRMEQLEGAELADGAEEAVEKASEKSAESDAVMEVEGESGEEPVRGGAAVGAQKQTSVGFDAEADEQTKVGPAGGAEEPPQGDSADEETESAEVADGVEGSEAVWKRRAEGYALRAVFSEARAAAAAMGVPEHRLDPVVRLSHLAGIDPEGEEARGRIARAVQAVLRELPELRGGVGTGQATAPRRPRRDAFERGFLGD